MRAILDLRLHRLTALGRDEIGDELQGTGRSTIAEYLAILGDRVKLYAVMRDELAEITRSLRHAARLRNRPRLGRYRRRGPDRARGHGRHRHAGRLHQAHPALDLPRAEPRRQGPRRHGDQGRGCGQLDCSSPRRTIRCCSSPPPARSIASRSGSCPKAGPPRAAGRSSTCCPRSTRAKPSPTVLPLPEDEASWGTLSVVFATAKGNVRRNSMDAFANVPSNGKFAMRFDEGSDDRLIGVALLDARRRRAARHAPGQGDPLCRRRRARIPEPHLHRRARHDCSRATTRSISLSILHRVGTTAEEREEYLRFAPWKAEKEGEPVASGRTLRRTGENANSSSSPSAPMAMASCPPLMNIAAPGAAARASPISTISAATARSWPASPRPRRTS